MTKVKSFLKRLSGVLNSDSSNAQHQKLTPNEVELLAHERREHLDNVKVKLHSYRKKNNILATPNWNKEFGEKEVSLLGNNNHPQFNKPKKESNLLRHGMSLW